MERCVQLLSRAAVMRGLFQVTQSFMVSPTPLRMTGCVLFGTAVEIRTGACSSLKRYADGEGSGEVSELTVAVAINGGIIVGLLTLIWFSVFKIEGYLSRIAKALEQRK